MNPSIFIWLVYAIWVVVIVYLTVAASAAKRDTQPDLRQSFGLMFALIAAFALPYVPIFGFVNFAPLDTVVSLVGIAVFLIGISFFVAARQQLGRNWSQTVSAKAEPELVTSGPYRYARHPMYTGGIVACIGSAIVVGGPFVFMFVTLVPIFLWRVGAEDKLMQRQFPDAYPEYRNRTKALIPFVW